MDSSFCWWRCCLGLPYWCGILIFSRVCWHTRGFLKVSIRCVWVFKHIICGRGGLPCFGSLVGGLVIQTRPSYFYTRDRVVICVLLSQSIHVHVLAPLSIDRQGYRG